MGRIRGLALLLALCAPCGRDLAAQDHGALAGTVVDEATLARLEGVTVTILGSGIRATTDEFGQFLLEGVPFGATSLRIASRGYVTVVEQIELAATDFLQVRLSPVAAALDELLVIAGRRPLDPNLAGQREHTDNSTRSALDILADDIPGVSVRRGGGNLGTGAAIAIRGVGTFGNSTPDIYLDGIRIDERSGGTRALNVLDLIAAETISRIQVFKGPAAATRYPNAANGVILIETHRGGGSGGNLP